MVDYQSGNFRSPWVNVNYKPCACEIRSAAAAYPGSTCEEIPQSTAAYRDLMGSGSMVGIVIFFVALKSMCIWEKTEKESFILGKVSHRAPCGKE